MLSTHFHDFFTSNPVGLRPATLIENQPLATGFPGLRGFIAKLPCQAPGPLPQAWKIMAEKGGFEPPRGFWPLLP